MVLGDFSPGRIHTVDTLAWSFTSHSVGGHANSSPVIDDDGFYYMGGGLLLIADCLHSPAAGLATGLANSAWPMYRHDPARTARAHLYPMARFILKKMPFQVEHFHIAGAAQPSLAAQLTSAIEAVEREHVGPALGKLGAFVRHVRAQSGKKRKTPAP